MPGSLLPQVFFIGFSLLNYLREGGPVAGQRRLSMPGSLLPHAFFIGFSLLNCLHTALLRFFCFLDVANFSVYRHFSLFLLYACPR